MYANTPVVVAIVVAVVAVVNIDDDDCDNALAILSAQAITNGDPTQVYATMTPYGISEYLSKYTILFQPFNDIPCTPTGHVHIIHVVV